MVYTCAIGIQDIAITVGTSHFKSAFGINFGLREVISLTTFHSQKLLPKADLKREADIDNPGYFLPILGCLRLFKINPGYLQDLQDLPMHRHMYNTIY